MGDFFTPRTCQLPMAEHILHTPRCAVWADMGLGKTTGTLYALRLLSMLEELPPVLVVAPKRVALSVWPSQARQFDNLKFTTSAIVGSYAPARKKALTAEAQIYTINYENLPWLVEGFGKRWPFKIVIADESTKLKSFRLGGPKSTGFRAKMLASVSPYIERFIELTGTPSTNGLQDLWGQFWFIDKGEALGRTYTAFERRWFVRENAFSGRYGRVVPIPGAAQEIEALIKPYVVRVDAADYFHDLQKPIESTVYVELPPPAMAQYKRMQKELFTQLDNSDVTANDAAGVTTKCLQIAAGAVYTDEGNKHWEEVHEEKLLALESIIEESAGAPLLVVYHWAHDRDRILKRFREAELFTDDPRTEERWNKGNIAVMLVHAASAGHGLNLQYGGNRMVFFSTWWDLEHRLQVIERIGPVRQLQAGFKRPVYIYNIVARDTIDELTIARHAAKKSVQDLLLERMKDGHCR
jgi:SNF2 family DNA or RNA helicase